MAVRRSLGGAGLLVPWAALTGACANSVTGAASDAGLHADAPADVAPPWAGCAPGQQRCVGDLHQTCVRDGGATSIESEDCRARGRVCVEGRGCIPCRPGEVRCAADTLGTERCGEDGERWAPADACDMTRGEACRRGRCLTLCDDEAIQDTSLGCEYYAVDLDNAPQSPLDAISAAAQQFAVVVSNPDLAVTARVEVSINAAPPGAAPRPVRVASAVIPPRGLEIFPLPSREVDCSTSPVRGDGTGTCLSSNAYRVTSTYPVVAYQFNPLDNVGAFSNDASLLLPSRSVRGDYRVLGYPQQYATEGVPPSPYNVDLRAFLTIVGTRPDTHVQVTARADVVPGGPLLVRQRAGAPFAVTLGPFDVLNLETGYALADFTGSLVQADQPVHVFTGIECGEVPFLRPGAVRVGACDHLEEQLPPAAVAGRRYVASRTPSRTAAVRGAGAEVAPANEPEWFRVLNAGTARVEVATTLPPGARVPAGGAARFALGVGEFLDLGALADFQIDATGPVLVGQFMGSQGTTGIPNALPGGDPSLIIVPPIEQWRREYVFLTPDQYAFDSVQVVAPPDARVWLDDVPVRDAGCSEARADGCVVAPGRPCAPPAYVTWRCLLSSPTIRRNGAAYALLPGRQNDGVHTVRSDALGGVMVLVSGFDRYVSYGYAAGMGLTPLR